MKSILVAVDFSDVSDRVVAKAGDIAKALGAKVWLMHAVTDTSFISGMGDVPVAWTVSDADLPRHFPSEMARLRDMSATLQDLGIDAQHLLVSGHGALYDLLVGTVSEGVMRRTDRIVMIVPSVAKKEPVAKAETAGWAVAPGS
jgi:nucleotide-binding universal stress UspA family protein